MFSVFKDVEDIADVDKNNNTTLGYFQVKKVSLILK